MGIAIAHVLKRMSHAGKHCDLHRFAGIEHTLRLLSGAKVPNDDPKASPDNAEHLCLSAVDVIRARLAGLAFD